MRVHDSAGFDTDTALMNEHILSVVEKHLIGQHDQAEHSRKDHGDKKDPYALSTMDMGVNAQSGGVAAALGGAVASNRLLTGAAYGPVSHPSQLKTRRNVKRGGQAMMGAMGATAATGLSRGISGTTLTGSKGAETAARRGREHEKFLNEKKRLPKMSERRDIKRKSKTATEERREKMSKHLIGRHDQGDHSRAGHKNDQKTKKQKLALGIGAGSAALGTVAYGPTTRMMNAGAKEMNLPTFGAAIAAEAAGRFTREGHRAAAGARVAARGAKRGGKRAKDTLRRFKDTRGMKAEVIDFEPLTPAELMPPKIKKRITSDEIYKHL